MSSANQPGGGGGDVNPKRGPEAHVEEEVGQESGGGVGPRVALKLDLPLDGGEAVVRSLARGFSLRRNVELARLKKRMRSS